MIIINEFLFTDDTLSYDQKPFLGLKKESDEDSKDNYWYHQVYLCPICDKNVQKEPNFLLHLTTHSGKLYLLCWVKIIFNFYWLTDGTQIKCPSCEKEIESPTEFCKHFTQHSSLKWYECLKCFKRFPIKAHVQNHLKSHSDEKSISCPLCERFFKSTVTMILFL